MKKIILLLLFMGFYCHYTQAQNIKQMSKGIAERLCECLDEGHFFVLDDDVLTLMVLLAEDTSSTNFAIDIDVDENLQNKFIIQVYHFQKTFEETDLELNNCFQSSFYEKYLTTLGGKIQKKNITYKKLIDGALKKIQKVNKRCSNIWTLFEKLKLE